MDSPPIGKELKIAKKLVKLVSQLDSNYNLIDAKNGFPPTISADHSIEGVRTNGWQGITTIADTILKLEELKDSLLHGSLIIDQSIAVIEKAVFLFKMEYEICSFCEGLHGFGGHSEDKVKLGNEGCSIWRDCEECNGRGFIKKKVK